MTDEKYTFIKDVSEKKNIAKSGGKKGKSRYGCKLPSDDLSVKERRAMNSASIGLNMNRPVAYEKFLDFSDEVKKEYLQNLIDNHGGTTSRIAKLFGCTEAKIKEFRTNLGITSVRFISEEDDKKWEEFLKQNDFLQKPMGWKTFRSLDYYDQTSYLNYLISTFNVTFPKMEQMFGVSYNSLHVYVNRHKLKTISRKNFNARMTNEEVKKWEEFVGEQKVFEEPDKISEEPAIEEKVEEPPIPEVHNEPEPEPIVDASNYGLNNFSMECTVQNLDQAELILHVFNTVRTFNLKEGTFIIHIKEG